MDTELFELCKEVYKRTEWKVTDNYYFYAWTTKGHKLTTVAEKKFKGQGYDDVPLYTSDHLIDKLPKFVNNTVARRHEVHGCSTCACEQGYKCYLELSRSDEKSMACYVSNMNSRAIPYLEQADTPLKALLKLTIALDDAGELNHV